MAKILLCLTVLALAGCGTTQRSYTYHVPDWEERAAPPAEGAMPPPSSIAPQSPPAPTPVPQSLPAKVREPLPTWVAFPTWCRAHGFPAPVRLAPSSPGIYEIRSQSGVLLLRIGSQIILWNAVELHLGFAPQLTDGQLYLHALDLNKTIQPLLDASTGLVLPPQPVIVIDPGHGGENAGTKSVLGNHYEKEFTLDLARRLQGLLNARGAQVFLTRSADYDLALSNRVGFAEEHKANLFLSLHFNSAAPSSSETGLETYCLTPVGMPSSLTRGFADEVNTTFPNNAFDTQNLQLALRVHRAILEVNGHHDRGVRRARFPGVLRGQQRPAILVEAGYLSNPQEGGLIEDPAYRQRLAQAVANALLEPTQQFAKQPPNDNGKSQMPNGKATGRLQISNGGTAKREAEPKSDDSGESSHTAEIPGTTSP